MNVVGPVAPAVQVNGAVPQLIEKSPASANTGWDKNTSHDQAKSRQMRDTNGLLSRKAELYPACANARRRVPQFAHALLSRFPFVPDVCQERTTKMDRE